MRSGHFGVPPAVMHLAQQQHAVHNAAELSLLRQSLHASRPLHVSSHQAFRVYHKVTILPELMEKTTALINSDFASVQNLLDPGTCAVLFWLN